MNIVIRHKHAHVHDTWKAGASQFVECWRSPCGQADRRSAVHHRSPSNTSAAIHSEAWRYHIVKSMLHSAWQLKNEIRSQKHIWQACKVLHWFG